MARDLFQEAGLDNYGAGRDLFAEAGIDAPTKPKPPGLARGIADTGLSFARGATGATKAIADAFGANNTLSGMLNKASEGIDSLESPYSLAKRQEGARRMEEASKTGSIWEEVKAAGQSFADRPLDFAMEGAGSILPTAAAALVTKSPAAFAGLGGVQGIGETKGQIYDTVKRKALESGKTEAEAERQAQEAQSYSGENKGQLAIGGGLGVLAAGTGVEKVLGGKAATGGVARRIATQAGMEAVPEAVQGGHQALASNLALQNAGYDVPTWSGVAGQSALEGLASMGVGGVSGIPATKQAQAETKPNGAPAETTEPDQPLSLPAPAIVTPQQYAQDEEAGRAAQAHADAVYGARDAFDLARDARNMVVEEGTPEDITLQPLADQGYDVRDAGMADYADEHTQRLRAARVEVASRQFQRNEAPESFQRWASDMDILDFIQSMPVESQRRASMIHGIVANANADPRMREMAAQRLWNLGQSLRVPTRETLPANAGPLAKAAATGTETGAIQTNKYGFPWTANIAAPGAPISVGQRADFSNLIQGARHGLQRQGQETAETVTKGAADGRGNTLPQVSEVAAPGGQVQRHDLPGGRGDRGHAITGGAMAERGGAETLAQGGGETAPVRDAGGQRSPLNIRAHIEAIAKTGKREADQLGTRNIVDRAMEKAKAAMEGAPVLPSYFRRQAKELVKRNDTTNAASLNAIADAIQNHAKAKRAGTVEPMPPAQTEQAPVTVTGNRKAPSNNLIKRIQQLGGVNLDYLRDVTGEGKAKGLPIGLFAGRAKDGKGNTVKGHGLDTLAVTLAGEGFPINLADETDNGGVNQLTDLIRNAISGRPVLNEYGRQDAMAREANAKEREALLGEAEKIGLNPPRNLSTAKLRARIDAEIARLEQEVSDKAVGVADDFEDIPFTTEELAAAKTGSDDDLFGDLGDGRGTEAGTEAQAGETARGRAEQDAATDRTQEGQEETGAQEEFGLTAPTRDDLRQQDREIERKRQAEADKAKADAMRADFTLTGSDREADKAIAQGAQELAPAEQETPQDGINAIIAEAQGKKVATRAIVQETGQVIEMRNQDAVESIQEVRGSLEALEALKLCIKG